MLKQINNVYIIRGFFKMMNFKKIFAATTITALLLTGCSSNAGAPKTQNTEQNESADKGEKTLSIAEGSKNMKDVLKDMKSKLDNKDEEGAVKASAGLEDNWKVFEDNVKDKDKELYEKVEQPLHTINAAVKIKPLDTKTLIDAIDALDKQLDEVGKLK